MRFATKLFLVVFWFVMGMFFFIMFSIHGIKGEIPPVTAFLGMTCFGLGFLYIACYCTERIARDIYRRLRKDFKAFSETSVKAEEEAEQKESEPTLFSEDELNNL